MRDPVQWKAPWYLNPEEQVIWQQCLCMFTARGMLQPLHEHWLTVFCVTVDRTFKLRQALASLPVNDANRTCFEVDEAEFTDLLLDQLAQLGFDSEQEFRAALQAQIQ